MKLINQSWEWMQKPFAILPLIERAGRVCYKTENKITPASASKFVRMILKNGHESVIEHAVASVRFITNRGVTHELVRHRLASYSQESTRYVNYGGKDMEFIRPVWFKEETKYYTHTWGSPEQIFIDAITDAELSYNNLLNIGWKPEQAREVLPNALKTEVVVTANLREWRHIFKLRTSKRAHPQIRALMLDCLEGFKEDIPILFDDIGGD